MRIEARALEELFHDCFFEDFQTVLEGGGAEPLYRPSLDLDASPHRVIYREDYVASALHEVAHWCLAGRERRGQEDYGYWYSPDGRDADQQLAFEQAEARPQALEWILSEACGAPFHLSADNLAGGLDPSERFGHAVEREKARLRESGLPPRAASFQRALERRFGTRRADPARA